MSPSKLSCAAVFGLALLLSACGGPCENTLLSQAPSPDGKQRAVAFERTCSGDSSTEVSLLDTDLKAPRPSVTVFSADRNHGAVKSTKVTLMWTSSTQLTITYAAGARVSQQDRSANGIAISYEATN